jgi:DNA-binding NarL/FixJ family response regulator
VALIGLDMQTAAPLALALQRAIPSCAVEVLDSWEQSAMDAAGSSPRLAIVDADALGSQLEPILEAIRCAAPACHLMVLAESIEEANIHRALCAGANTYLPAHYNAAQRELVLRLAWEGAGHLPCFLPRPTQRFDRDNASREMHSTERAEPRGAQALTPKQAEVLSYLAHGKSNRDIAGFLGIKEGTVKLHVTAILRKLEVDSRGQAMLVARRLQRVQHHILDQGRRGTLVLDGLMPHASHRHYSKGDIIFRKGDPGGELFYVQRGTVHMDDIGEDMGPGDIFGEVGVFSPEHERTSTARCTTDVDVFCVEAEKAKHLYFEHPHFAMRIATLLAQRLVIQRSR